jgi:structural maintenance of chromosome 1
MDALSFVLGVQAKQLRSEKLRDLIYRKEGENPKENQRTASVELTYIGSDIGEEGCDITSAINAGADTLVFKRLILRQGEARFQVNGEIVSQADYHKRLESINILSKVRNFLVFQGDVEATAQRQGKDLTAFFEQISGSEAFRAEYERLAAEKSKKEDNARYLFTKKRNAINEKRRVSLQKDEADEYRRTEAERRSLQRQFYLFRLHNMSRQLEDSSEARRVAESERALASASVETNRAAQESADRERAQAHLATGQAERSVAATRAKLDKELPERVAVRSRLNFLRQRIDDMQQHADKDGRRQQQLENQVQILRGEQERLEAEGRNLRARLSERELRFTPEQRKEFEQAKLETERDASSQFERARELEHQINTLAAERAQKERDQREVLGRRAQLQQQVAELQEAEQVAQAAMARDIQLAQKCSQDVERLQVRGTEVTEEKEQLQDERSQLSGVVQDMTATERQLQREREDAKVCAGLMEAMPGVHGRVTDLCRPTQKRLHVAVNVAIGKFVDGIIVDTSDTARACVRYLKERMLQPMTFLPLNDLRAPIPDPRLPQLVNGQQRMRLALNCISFEERFSRAFEFMLGDVVVADTMADGRRFAFEDARQQNIGCKVVTLAGEAIAKNGNLSVNSEAAREGATRFDLADLEQTKARLSVIDRRLFEIHSIESAGGADMAALHDEARRAEAKSSEATARFRWCQMQITQKREALRESEDAVKMLEPECAELAKKDNGLRKDLQRIEERIGKDTADKFAALSRAMGVPDVRKAEREWRREEQTARQREDELSRQFSNVKAELAMLTETLEERAARDGGERVPKLRTEIEQLTAKESKLSAIICEIESELKASEARANGCVGAEGERERTLVRLRQESKEQRQQLMALEKHLGDLASQEQTLHDARTDILRQSVLEDIEIPLLQGGFEALQDLVDAPSQAASAPTQRPPDASVEAVTVDFSALPPEKQAASTGPAAKMLEEEYRTELERLRVVLERLSPNLKAIDQLQGVAENVQAASTEADAARKDIEDVETQFENIKNVRKERFMECFTKVAGEISAIYRRLTSYTAGLQSDGGSAYLDLEDTEEPFNGGIKFTAMPPAKRFRDMHLLSGGEKTLAAVALLFAVHAYQKPPFMVLDEIDAALDANNVKALGAFIEQADIQTIVISLKDKFFVRSKALVGVWKNKPEETSATLSLDLSRYLPSQGR